MHRYLFWLKARLSNFKLTKTCQKVWAGAEVLPCLRFRRFPRLLVCKIVMI
jgi:hypothetical protein